MATEPLSGDRQAGPANPISTALSRIRTNPWAVRARTLAGRAGPVASRSAARIGAFDRRVADIVSDAAIGPIRQVRRWWVRRPAARYRRVAALASEPLQNLYEAHPEARQAIGHALGLRSVPLDEICGTAVAGAAQRGRDFLPLPPFRSQNWQGRWQRIRRAVEQLAVLPPIEVIRYDGCYWVTDGHNRVAAALYTGQLEIDADVTELVRSGEHGERPGSLAPVLTESRLARAAGEGRLTPGAASPARADEQVPDVAVATRDDQPAG